MAKKRKLNKRAVAVLIALGGIVLLGVSAWVVERLPRNAAEYARRGEEETNRGNLEKAEEYYAIAVANNRNNDANYLYLLAKTKLDMTDANYLKTRGRQMTETESREKRRQAVSLYQQAMRLAPTYADPQRALCNLAWDDRVRYLGGRKNYIEEATRLLQIVPGDPKTYWNRGRAQVEDMVIEDSLDAGRVDAALADYHKALELKPDEVGCWLDLINVLRRVNRGGDVPATLELAVSQDPNALELRVVYAEYLRARGEPNDVLAALAQINEAIARHPNSPGGYVARAQHHIALGEMVEAGGDLDQAEKIDDSDYQIYQVRSELLLRRNGPNDANEAIDAIRRGVETVSARLGKESPPAETRRLQEASCQLNYLLGERLLAVYERTKDEATLAEIQTCLDVLNRFVPGSPQHARIAGLLAFIQGRLKEAVALLPQAVAERGRVDLVAINALINSYLRLGQPSKALDVLEGLRRIPGMRARPMLAVMAADLRLRTGDLSGAGLEVAKALTEDPTYGPARNLKVILDVLSGNRYSLPDGVHLEGLHVALLLDRAAQMASEQKPREAIALLEDLHRRFPASTQVMNSLLDLCMSTDQMDRVNSIIQEVHASDPNLAAWIAEDVRIRKEPNPRKQFELRKARVERDVSDPIQKALDLSDQAARLGLAEESRRYLEQAAQLDANHPRVVGRMFLESLRSKDWKGTEEWVQRARAINLDGARGEMCAAQLASSQGDLQRAVECMERVVAIRPDYRSKVMLADSLRGRALELASGKELPEDARKMLDRAQALYEDVLRSDAGFFPAVKGMALLTELQGKVAEHDEWARKAGLLPQGRDDEYTQRQVLRLMARNAQVRDVPRLIAQREKLLKMNPMDGENIYALGYLYEWGRRPADAERMYRMMYDKNANRLSGARPLAEFYGRNSRLGDLLDLFSELEKQDVDPVGRQILAGNALSHFDSGKAQRAYEQAIDKGKEDPRGHLALASFWERQGRWDDAVTAHQKYLELVPKDRMGMVRLARARIIGGQLAEANQTLTALLEQDPGNANALSLQGVLAMRQRRFPDAQRAFDEALKVNSQAVDALLGRAELNLITGQPEKSRKDLQDARALANDPFLALQYAQVCRYLGDARAAEMAYLEVLNGQPDYAPAIRALSLLYLATENWLLLEPRLEEAKRLFPRDTQYLLLEAEMWKARKEPAKALAALEAATTLEAATALGSESCPAALAYLMALMDDQRYRQVIAQADAYQSKPALAFWARLLKACALVRLGQASDGEAAFLALLKGTMTSEQAVVVEQQVIRAYDSAAAACPRVLRWVQDGNVPDPQGKVLLGFLYADANDYPAAVRWLEAAWAAAPTPREKVTVGMKLAATFYAQGEFAKAEKQYLELVQLAPGNLFVLNNLAYLYAGPLKSPQKALPYAQRAQEQDPGNPNVVDTYGWVLVQMGRYGEGIGVLRRAAAIARPSAVFLYHLGYAYEQAGQLSDAATTYEEGLKLPPGREESVRDDLQKGLDRVRPKVKPE